jgi:putative hydrolase of the HAD superfamily
MARAMAADLSRINCWIFDLDNTLYPARTNLFALIDVRMGLYIQTLLGVDAQEARRIQKGYFVDYGTTLSGLMTEHQIIPDSFLDFVHDIPMDRLQPAPHMAKAINALPGRKLVFTNGDTVYAEKVLAALDLTDCFESVFDIRDAGYRPKPKPEPYHALCQGRDIDPSRALFVEDMVRNLAPAKSLGMATVWVNNGSEQAGAAASPDYVDFETPDLSHWLTELMETVEP